MKENLRVNVGLQEGLKALDVTQQEIRIALASKTSTRVKADKAEATVWARKLNPGPNM